MPPTHRRCRPRASIQRLNFGTDSATRYNRVATVQTVPPGWGSADGLKHPLDDGQAFLGLSAAQI